MSEHIKIFNKKWNYFENMSADEIEFFLKSDVITNLQKFLKFFKFLAECRR